MTLQQLLQLLLKMLVMMIAGGRATQVEFLSQGFLHFSTTYWQCLILPPKLMTLDIPTWGDQVLTNPNFFLGKGSR